MDILLGLISSCIAIGIAGVWAMKAEEKGYHDPIIIGLGWLLMPFVIVLLVGIPYKIFGLG